MASANNFSNIIAKIVIFTVIAISGLAFAQTSSEPKCSFCGIGARPKAKFCTECGRELPKPAKIACPECKSQTLAKANFCTQCGATLKKKNEKCPSCGSENASGNKFCVQCGAAMKAGAVANNQTVSAPADPAKTAAISGSLPISKPAVQPGPDANKTNLSNLANLSRNGDLLMKIGEYEKAAGEYSKAMDIDKASANLMLKLGIANLRIQNLDESMRFFSAAAKANPGMAETYYYMAQVSRWKNETDEELKYLKKALSLRAGYLRAVNDLACNRISDRCYDEAVEIITQNTTENDRLDYPVLMMNQAVALIYRKKYEAAQKLLSAAISKDPKNRLLYYNMGVAVYSQNSFGEALDKFDEALKADPDHVDSIIDKSIILIRMSKYNEAAEILKKALEKNPQSAQLHLNLASCLESTGAREEAAVEAANAATLNRAFILSSFPSGIFIGASYEHDMADDPQLFAKPSATADEAFATGNFYFNRGFFAPALEEFKKAAELKSDFAEAFLKAGTCLGLLNKSKEAEEMLKKCIEMKPEICDAYVNLSRVYVASNETGPALDIIMRGEEKAPGDYRIFYQKGIILRATGKKSEAAKAFEKCISLGPDEEKSQKARKYLMELK